MECFWIIVGHAWISRRTWICVVLYFNVFDKINLFCWLLEVGISKLCSLLPLDGEGCKLRVFLGMFWPDSDGLLNVYFLGWFFKRYTLAPQSSSLKASFRNSLNCHFIYNYGGIRVCDFCQISPIDERKGKGGKD